MIWNIIEYQDAGGQTLVARVPQNGTAELTTGSQLIVQEGQVATFFHDGRPADMFRAGRYSLTTQNLPLLGKVLNLVSFGRSPLRSSWKVHRWAKGSWRSNTSNSSFDWSDTMM